MKRLAIIFVALLALAACGDDAPDKGYVVGKAHTDAYVTTVMVCASMGKYGCQAFVPITQSYPESWRVQIRDCDTGKKQDNGEPKCDVGWRGVDEQTWTVAVLGDWLDFRRAKS